MNKFYVYVWLDPRKQGKYIYGNRKFLHEPIYVGKGKGRRHKDYHGHNLYLKRKSEKFNKPIILIIKKELSENQAHTLEKELIALIGRHNLGKGPLCNLTDGGDGTSGHVLSEESKNKIRSARAKQIMTKETRKKIGDSNRGQKRTEEFCKKIGNIHRGKKLSEHHKNLIRIARAKQIMSEATKKKISESCKGKIVSKETREKLSKAKKGKKLPPMSEEAKKKISEFQLGRKKSKTEIENIRKARLGTHHTEESKQKNRNSHLGKKRGPCSDETKKKISEANKGKIRSLETKTKISTALRRNFDNIN